MRRRGDEDATRARLEEDVLAEGVSVVVSAALQPKTHLSAPGGVTVKSELCLTVAVSFLSDIYSGKYDSGQTMLFKTISASVYGIDAYPVEVEVDVGSAFMKDFNVVGGSKPRCAIVASSFLMARG